MGPPALPPNWFRRNGGIFSFGKSRAVPITGEQTGVTFADVAGVDEDFEGRARHAAGSQAADMDNVEFLGALPQAELAAVLQAADVFVLPSFFEGLPLVVVGTTLLLALYSMAALPVP